MTAQQLLSAAQSGHGGDKQSLLAAINDAAKGLRPVSSVKAAGADMMKSSNVAASVQRDLQSYTKTKPEMRDFDHLENQLMLQKYELERTMPTSNRKDIRGPDDDTRSVASEYDYGSKKKFTDVLGNTNHRNKRKLDEAYLKNAMMAQQSERSRGSKGSLSLRSQTLKDHLRYKSGIVNDLSMVPSARIKHNPHEVHDTIKEEDDHEYPPRSLSELNMQELLDGNFTEEERVEQYKIMRKALEEGKDSEFFPGWLRQIIMSNNAKGQQTKYEDLLNAGIPDKIGFFPSNKKMYEMNQFQNSEEFKQLGTLTKENRHMEYYPVGGEQGNKSVLLGFQSSNNIVPAGAARGQLTQLEGKIAEGRDGDDALGRELMKLQLMKDGSGSDTGFPATTNQDHHHTDVNGRQNHACIDKSNFKTKNPFMAYVDSSFSSGVFTHPWRDMY